MRRLLQALIAGGLLAHGWIWPACERSWVSRGRGTPVTCLCAAKVGRLRGVGPAQKLQDALTIEDILSTAAAHLDDLKASHLSSALLRIAKGQLNNDLATKDALKSDARLRDVVSRCGSGLVASRDRSTARHVADYALSTALLGVPIEEQMRMDLWGMLEKRLGGMAPEDISTMFWAWEETTTEPLPRAFQDAVEGLPFQVLAGVLEDQQLEVETIAREVDLRRDTITIGSKQVDESRLTGWEGPYPFAYSGKVMPAAPMTPSVARVRDRLLDLTGVYFDCCLINLYPDGKSGMRFHQDPDQGVYWTEETVVCSIGDTREFILREVNDHSRRHRFFVSGGDAVRMFGRCQVDYQHAIKVCEEASDAGPRVSLVYKQSLEQGRCQAAPP